VRRGGRAWTKLKRRRGSGGLSSGEQLGATPKWRKGSGGGGVRRSAHVAAAGARHSRGRGPVDDTDPDASGAGGMALLRAVREQHRGRERERDETDMWAPGV
jgi:hypothetical protein